MYADKRYRIKVEVEERDRERERDSTMYVCSTLGFYILLGIKKVNFF